MRQQYSRVSFRREIVEYGPGMHSGFYDCYYVDMSGCAHHGLVPVLRLGPARAAQLVNMKLR